MSKDPEFMALIETLLKHPNSSERSKAAKALGDFVYNLNDEEYEDAKNALNKALSDKDPMVLMSAMGALTKYNRKAGSDDYEVVGDREEDLLPPPTKAACKVCGRPEALIPDGGCERDDCPYR
jgi:hypothetical protein